MDTRSLTASITVFFLSSCATVTAPTEQSAAEPEARAMPSTASAPGQRVTAAPAAVDEISTDADKSPKVCRSETATGSRLEKITWCWPKGEDQTKMDPW